MPPLTEEFACVSSQPSIGSACFGAIMPNDFWYPLGIGDYISYQGRTYEIFFYHTSESATAIQSLRGGKQNGSDVFRIDYQRLGSAQGPGRWDGLIAGAFSSVSFGFNFQLEAFEWYRMVIRTVAFDDTTTAAGFPGGANRLIIQIGKVGTRTTGTTSGEDTFPYGIGANGGFGQAFIHPGFGTFWQPIKAFGGSSLQAGSTTRLSWGGAMDATGVNPSFTRKWKGGFCEERLWLPALTDAEVAANSGFVSDQAPAVYLRFNQSIPDVLSYVSSGSTVFADQVGFSYGGSKKVLNQGDVAMINHVDPVIITNGLNPTGFPEHPFLAVADIETETSLGEYLVLTTGEEQASGEYNVLQTQDSVVEGAYFTNSFGTEINSGEYRSLYALGQQRLGEYRVANDPVELGPFEGAYGVLIEENDLTATGAYEIEQVPTDIIETGEYKVLQVVEITGGASDLFTETVLAGTLPTHWWRLDEPGGSATVADTGSDGTGGGTVNGVTLGAPGLLSDDETSGSFDQSGDEITSVLDDTVWQTNNISHDYTWNVWVRLQAVVDGIGTIFAKTAYANLRITESGGLMAARYERTTDGSNLRSIESPFGAIQTDTSHMITVTFDRTNFLGTKIYIDGVLQDTDPFTFGQNTPLNQQFVVGGVFNTVVTNNGIQHVQFYEDILLSELDISALYAAGQPIGGSVGTGEYKVAAPETIVRPGSYRVDGIPPSDINRFGDYAVTSDVVEINQTGDYRVSSGPGIIQATGEYEVDAGIQEINLQRSGGYAVRNADNEREAALRKLAWLRMKTK